jgi:hypothetical protein
MVSKIARIINGEIVYSDKSAEVIKPHDMASRSRREAMKVKHRKDLLQKNQVDYYKAYPKELDNLSDETKRLLS